MPPLPFKLPSTRVFFYFRTIFVVSIQGSLNCLIATNDKLFLGNQLLFFQIKSYNIFCTGMATRLQQIFVHICANVAHKCRYSDMHIFKKNLWTIISIFCHRSSMCSHCHCLVLSLLLLSSLIFVWPMLSSLCFVCDLFCARSPVMCFMQCTPASSSHARAISAFGLNSPNFPTLLRFCKARV